MTPHHPGQWHLERFLDALDDWIDREHPSENIRFRVTEWILSRFEDPYVDARREPAFANLWYCVVPSSLAGDDVVTCSYWIEEATHTVRCDSFATLTYPA